VTDAVRTTVGMTMCASVRLGALRATGASVAATAACTGLATPEGCTRVGALRSVVFGRVTGAEGRSCGCGCVAGEPETVAGTLW
jgi:hypothetical protein